jgi:hypothetical protein
MYLGEVTLKYVIQTDLSVGTEHIRSIFKIQVNILFFMYLGEFTLKYVIQSDLSVGTEHIGSIFKIQVKYIIFYVSDQGACDGGIIGHWNFFIRSGFGV